MSPDLNEMELYLPFQKSPGPAFVLTNAEADSTVARGLTPGWQARQLKGGERQGRVCSKMTQSERGKTESEGWDALEATESASLLKRHFR